MEDVEVKEFYSVSAATVQSENGMSWSEDHKISLISSSALHVLEVIPNPSVTTGEMSLRKSIIKPTDEAPTTDAGVDTSRLFYLLEQREAYRMLLDMKLAPHFPDAKPPEPRFTTAQWSPASMYQDHRCIIATLTCTGCLKLHVPHFNSWVEVIDLSKHWLNYCKTLWIDQVEEADNAPVTFAILQRRTSQIKITGIAWGEMIQYDLGRYSHMATVSHSGTLALWKLNYLTDLGIPAQEYKPEILTVCETHLYNACTLHWMQWNKQEISVIVGDTNGCVKIITFSFNNSDNTVSMLYMKDIWNEKDLMQVSCIKSLPHSSLCQSEQRILAVVKNSYLLIFLVTQENVISCCHDHIGGLPLTGLEVLNSETFIICALSGVLRTYKMKVEQTGESYKLSTSSKNLKSNLSWQDVACFGIAKNCNNDIWTLCTNLCKMYDHLVMRRPSQIVFITFSDTEDSWKQLNNGMPAVICTSKLRFHWESLEIYRMNYLKQLKAQPGKELELCQDPENLSTTELQMELWRARIMVTHLVNTDVVVRNPEICAYVTLLEELIMCRHACKYCCTLVERHKVQPLDEKCLYTLGLLRLWLQTWLSHNKVNWGTDKISESKIVVSDAPDVANSNVKDVNDSNGKDESKIEMDTTDNAHVSGASSLSGSVIDVNENVGDNDAVSVGSFDDAISTDSNSSSIVSDKTVISKRVQIQLGRVPASFLKTRLPATCEQVTSVLALPSIPGTLEKELCSFCEQEVQMDIDWRTGTCPANHRLSRCCQCLSRCHRMPYRVCFVCPAVSCLDIDCDLQPFCTFCDSPLTLDDKFKKPGFTPSQEEEETEPAKTENRSEDQDEECKKSDISPPQEEIPPQKDEGKNVNVKTENASELPEVSMEFESEITKN